MFDTAVYDGVLAVDWAVVLSNRYPGKTSGMSDEEKCLVRREA